MPKNIRKILRFSLYVLLMLVLILVGWTVFSFYTVPSQRTPRDFPEPTTQYDFGKVLVVYYSLSGNTAEIAERIGDMTNGSLFEIETEKSYPSIPASILVAMSELKNTNFPDLKKTVDDFSSYDVIFVGAPVWMYTVATPMLSFLSQADFKGKTVVPFVTDGGNYGDFFVRFAQEARNANILEGENFTHVSRTDTDVLDQKISAWLARLMKELPKPAEN